MEDKPKYLTVIADNRITLPAKFRKQHGIEVGDSVIAIITKDSLIIKPPRKET